jgi:hypothetical protein
MGKTLIFELKGGKQCMKKTILISGLIIVLLISNAIFVRQMSEAQSTSGNREEKTLFHMLVGVTEVLTESPAILDLYTEDFTEAEHELFCEAINSVSRTMNQIEGTLNYIHVDDLDWHRELYQNGIFPIQRTMEEIADGEIHSEETVHEISNILREQGQFLSDMIYVEQIGIEGLYDEENQEKIRAILQEANRRIEEEI